MTISDRHPLEMVLDDGPHVHYWEGWDWADHPAEHYFIVTLDALQPGWRVGIEYDMRIPDAGPVASELVLANTLDVTLVTGDVNPEDNGAPAAVNWADVNCDRLAHNIDVHQVAVSWRCAEGDTCYQPRYDLDDDGVITIVDVMLVVR